MASTPTPTGARPTLLLALVMSFLGIAGVGRSWVLLSTDLPAHDPNVPELSQRLTEILLTSQLHKAVIVANLLVSALLVVGSFLVTARRPSGLWWVTQALWANLAYTAADTLTSIWLLREHATEIIPLLERDLAAQSPDAAPVNGGDVLWAAGAGIAAVSLVLVAIYAVLLRLSRRPDVRRFVEQGAATAE